MKIDGVFAGGGLKAFSYIGVLESFEEHGYELERVAGTSAGAIIAGFIAAGYTKEEITNFMEELSLESFLDAPKIVRLLPFTRWAFLYKQLGLYYGNKLEKWLYEKLAHKNIYTFSDVEKGSFKIVVSDISEGKLIVLPDDLEEVYGQSASTFSVARAIRMSVGYPYFFMPKKIKNKAGGESLIVDGGLLSNFPLWIFDTDRKRSKRPIIGVKLTSSEVPAKPKKIKNALDMLQAVFSTMIEAHDNRYISKSKQKHIIFIPVSDKDTLNFSMSDEQIQSYIQEGYKKANAFLSHWP